ncbi:hypothetical protein BD410DRAFT_902696 [Rickenella mellea]|uniref:DUF6534 domain-containing protein n=1 Tax=Rickenella mellea TaxID=50990 RepID=A0A4Y7PJK9_9AGAM|nr:hypothetical protein BD410DRAFT_902696 [Rickenella mellea]
MWCNVGNRRDSVLGFDPFRIYFGHRSASLLSPLSSTLRAVDDTMTQVANLDNTMGALFLAVVLAMSLWGAGSVQVYYYFNRYRTDDWRTKTLVLVVWALDTMHQALITHAAYTYLVTWYGQPAKMAIIVPSLLWEVVVSAVICFLVQCFLVRRIWHLSHKNIWLVGSIMSIVVAELIVSLTYVGEAIPLKTYAALAKIVNLSRAINALGAAGDVAIAGALITLLNSQRTGFRSSETIINRLILFTMNTGLLTSICAIMSLITITVLPTTFVYISFYVTVSRLYTNSLLATLNVRKSIRGGHPDSSENMSLSMGRYRGGGQGMDIENGHASKGSQHVLSVKVDTETMRDYDDPSKEVTLTDGEEDRATLDVYANKSKATAI